MIAKILLGYDGSASAERALGFAIETAQKYGAQLHVLAVARPPDLGTEIEVEPVIERELKHYESVLAGMRDKLDGSERTASKSASRASAPSTPRYASRSRLPRSSTRVSVVAVGRSGAESSVASRDGR